MALAFLAFMKIRKNIQFMYLNNVEEKHIDFLLIGEGEKNIMLSSKILIHSYMIIITLWKKTFLSSLFTSFHYRKLKRHINDYFKINGKQTIKIPKKG